MGGGATIATEAAPLVAEGVGRRYRRSRPWALHDVSLEVPEGSITALVGANGAGKSTLIRSCLGFERPNEGRVLVFGIDPRQDRAAAVASIGYVPQATALYRGLSIVDHFVMAKAARPAFDTAFAQAHVERVGLATKRRVSELSGGEQAQVTLALALAGRAPLLLLDEPLASLDPLARRDFLTALLADVRGRGATAVLSSHIVTDVEQACDRLVVLAEGQLVLSDTVAAVRERYRTVQAESVAGGTVLGWFAGPDGGLLALVDGGAIGRQATLEEVVLGHLAARRQSPRLAA
jgi:ABC-2 type transport system ATP-binding protein